MLKKDGLSAAQLRSIALVYISLPLVCFAIGFLRWYWAVLCCATLLFLTVCGRRRSADSEYFAVSRSTVLIVFLVSLLWSYFGGMNGYYYQSTDWNCRNAIYFDLIQYDWPVIWPKNGGALVYYVGHWLPPAVAAKIILGLSASFDIALVVGRISLWLWSSLGLTIVFLLLFLTLKVLSVKQRAAAIVMMVFFSGLDILGAYSNYMLPLLLHPSCLHLENWTYGLQFSSITTCLFWVFNQSIVPWIITLLFLQDESPRAYVYYCVCCLLCGPFPCCGLTVLMAVKALTYIIRMLREKKPREMIGSLFSVQNILSLLTLFPFVALYIISTNSVGGEAGSFTAVQPAPFFDGLLLSRRFLHFVMIEVGLYWLFIWIDHYREPLFYAVCISFLFLPSFHVGTSIDFCMRATIPAVFILMVYVARFLMDHLLFPREGGRGTAMQRTCAWIVTICFLIGAATPAVEFYRGFYHVREAGTVCLEDQRIMTFNRDNAPYNFGCNNPQEHFFFKYMAK